jgi:hypothetical protein
MEKTGVSENELKCFDKTLFELIVGMEPDIFTRLYQAGIINIKENIKTLDSFIKDFGIEETIKIFKLKKAKK